MNITLMDGGMGIELFRIGVPRDEEIWSARALIEEKYHKLVITAHLNFINAGAEYITTNNYAVIPSYLKKIDQLQNLELLTKCAGELAKKAATKNTKVLGSLPPLVESYRPDLLLDKEQSVAYYKQIIQALEPYVDLYIAETMSSITEALNAICALQDLNKDYFLAWTVNSKGQLRSCENINQAINAIIDHGCLPKVLLFNCSYPEFITKALKEINAKNKNFLEKNNIHLGAYANRSVQDPEGSFNLENSTPKLRSEITPEVYLEYVKEWYREGGRFIGGCCGISPDYIRYIYENS